MASNRDRVVDAALAREQARDADAACLASASSAVNAEAVAEAELVEARQAAARPAAAPTVAVYSSGVCVVPVGRRGKRAQRAVDGDTMVDRRKEENDRFGLARLRNPGI